MPLAEQDLARAQIAERDQFAEARPLSLDEGVRQAVPRPDDDHAVAERRRDLVVGFRRALVDPTLRLPLHGHQHDGVAAKLEGDLIRSVVANAAVSETIAEDGRRAGVKRRKKVRAQQQIDRALDRLRVDEKPLSVAQTGQGDDAGKGLGCVQPVADETREVAPVHFRVTPGRELVEQIAQIDMRHARERAPHEPGPMLDVRRHDGRVPRTGRNADGHRRVDPERGQALDHAHLKRTARRAAGKHEGDLFRLAQTIEPLGHGFSLAGLESWGGEGVAKSQSLRVSKGSASFTLLVQPNPLRL